MFIPSHTFSIIITYTPPHLLLALFISHHFPLTFKFKYNQSSHKMPPPTFNKTFSFFPNIIITGISLILSQQNSDPDIFSQIKFLKPHAVTHIKLSKYYNYKKTLHFHAYKNLHSLSLTKMALKNDFSTELNNLRHLDLSKCNHYYTRIPISDNIIARQPNLRSYYLPFGTITNATKHLILKLKKLHTISIPEGNPAASLTFLSSIPSLKCIKLKTYNDSSLPNLSKCHKVRRLIIDTCYGLSTIDNLHLFAPPFLRHLEIINCCHLNSITNLSLCFNLKSIKITKCKSLHYISPTTKQMEITGCPILNIPIFNPLTAPQPID